MCMRILRVRPTMWQCTYAHRQNVARTPASRLMMKSFRVYMDISSQKMPRQSMVAVAELVVEASVEDGFSAVVGVVECR